jgi:RHS repeat-associated protein
MNQNINSLTKNMVCNYNPSTGRFLSEDPIGFSSGDVTLYRYVGNSPYRYIDPFGLTNEAILVQIGFGDCVKISINNTFYIDHPEKQKNIQIKNPDTGRISTGKGCIMACSGVVGIGYCREIEPPKCKGNSL